MTLTESGIIENVMKTEVPGKDGEKEESVIAHAKLR